MADSSQQRGQPGGLGYNLVISAVFLALAGSAAVAFLVALGAVTPSEIAGDWELGYQLLLQVEDQPWQARALTVAGAGIAGLLCLAVMAHQWAPARARAAFHMLDADDRGFVVVDSRGIAVVAEQAAMSAQGVIGAQAVIKGSGTTPIRVNIRVDLYPGANIKRAGTQVREAVAQAMEELVGLEVRDITVNTHIVESDLMTRVLA